MGDRGSGEYGIKVEEVISSFSDIKMECEDDINKCDPVECLASKGNIDMQKPDYVSVSLNSEKPLAINDIPSESIPSDASGERQIKEETVSGVCFPNALEIPVADSLAEGAVSKMDGDTHPNADTSTSFISDIYGKGNHKCTHVDREPFSCGDCGKSFSCRSSLLLHMRVHTNERQFSCRVCGKSFQREDNLQAHMITHGDEKLLSCVESGKSISGRDSLKEHEDVHMGENSLECPNSRTPLPNQSKFEKLLRYIDNPFVCKDCGSPLSVPSSFQKLMRVLCEDEQFSCKHKIVREKDGLKVHLQFFMPVKVLPCSKRENYFREMSSLDAGTLDTQAIQSKDKVFLCPKCRRSFIQTSPSERPLEFQTGKGNFCRLEIDKTHMRCGPCQEKSNNVEQLFRSGLRPYVCPICGRHLRKLLNLARHMRLHKSGFRN